MIIAENRRAKTQGLSFGMQNFPLMLHLHMQGNLVLFVIFVLQDFLIRKCLVKMYECWCKNCDEWYDTTKVEFLNVEENAYGEDSFTFTCHVCDEKQTSLVRNRDYEDSEFYDYSTNSKSLVKRDSWSDVTSDYFESEE